MAEICDYRLDMKGLEIELQPVNRQIVNQPIKRLNLFCIGDSIKSVNVRSIDVADHNARNK